MSWTIGSVTLPKSPERFQYRAAANSDSFKPDGGTAIVFGTGLDLETLDLSIPLSESGATWGSLETNYIGSLKSYLNTAVAVSFPVGVANGTWLMTGCEASVDKSISDPNYVLTLKFVRGASIIVI